MTTHLSEPILTLSRPRAVDWAWLAWANRRALAQWCLYGLAIGIITSFLIPSEYESTTRLMPPDTRSNSNLGSGLAMMMSQGAGALAAPLLGGGLGDLLGKRDTGAVFLDMLRSRTVQDRIINRFDLRKVYRVRYYQDARKKLEQRSVLMQDRKSGVITITVTDRDPRRAAQIAQSYVEELDRIAAEVNTSAARRERTFIEQRLKGVKQDLDEASHKFSEFSSKNATLDLKDQGRATVEAAAALQGQLIASQAQLEGLEQIYSENNVRVRALRARVDELQRQLKKVGGTSSSTDYANTASLPPNTEFPSIRELPLLGVRWAELYRQAKIQEAVYGLLTEQYEQAKIEEAKETPSVKVLDTADVPERRSSPHRTYVTLLGAFCGFILCLSWIGGGALWNSIDPEDSRKQLGNEIRMRWARLWSSLLVHVRRARN
jgi:capsule polysaccharide export protein KpsE/RkpR